MARIRSEPRPGLRPPVARSRDSAHRGGSLHRTVAPGTARDPCVSLWSQRRQPPRRSGARVGRVQQSRAARDPRSGGRTRGGGISGGGDGRAGPAPAGAGVPLVAILLPRIDESGGGMGGAMERCAGARRQDARHHSLSEAQPGSARGRTRTHSDSPGLAGGSS